jgi:RNA recognition motif-containing protein
MRGLARIAAEKQPKEPGVAKRIYVGGLPYSATESQLEELFKEHGQVSSVEVITDRHTGQAKGFAFVEMTTDSEAATAIAALNGTQMGGRTLTVNEARARETTGGSRFGGGGGGGRSGGGGGGGGRRW